MLVVGGLGVLLLYLQQPARCMTETTLLYVLSNSGPDVCGAGGVCGGGRALPSPIFVEQARSYVFRHLRRVRSSERYPAGCARSCKAPSGESARRQALGASAGLRRRPTSISI